MYKIPGLVGNADSTTPTATQPKPKAAALDCQKYLGIDKGLVLLMFENYSTGSFTLSFIKILISKKACKNLNSSKALSDAMRSK